MTYDLRFDRRRFLASSALAAGAFTLPASSFAAEACDPSPIINPIVFQRADPFVTRTSAGDFLFTASVPEYDRIILRSSKTLAGLGSAEERILWRRPARGQMGGHIWAPEIHRIDGKWLIYFAAGNSAEVFHIRTYVLACDSDDPITGNWSVLGQLQTPWDTFTLDSTSFRHCGTDYLCWAQQEPGIETNSNLYLAPLETPTTLAAAPVRLTVPTLPWEIQGFKVNEGPALLRHGEMLFLTYSASATDARYAMGMLSVRADADIMDPTSWTKSKQPVFRSAPERCIYGPGHNSFTTDECGRDVIVYHARSYPEVVGDPLYDPNRHARIQHVKYDAQGFPVFGKPVPAGPLSLTEA